MAKMGDLTGTIRGRVLPGLPIRENFDEIHADRNHHQFRRAADPFAYPPLPWIGARFKFEVREKDGNKCLVKTIDNPFFQRAMVFMGHAGDEELHHRGRRDERGEQAQDVRCRR